jgi:hypothetical protein
VTRGTLPRENMGGTEGEDELDRDSAVMLPTDRVQEPAALVEIG